MIKSENKRKKMRANYQEKKSILFFYLRTDMVSDAELRKAIYALAHAKEDLKKTKFVQFI
jgi:hypothetical protein